MKKIALSFICTFLSTVLMAENFPKAFSSDARIKEVLFQENNVVSLEAQTFITSQIQLGGNERVLDIEGGDTTSWMVTHHPELPNMVFVKPTALNSKTNMTIVSNQHVYYFHLKSNANLNPNETPTYALKFIYSPHHEPLLKPKILSKNPISNLSPVHAAYRFSGSPQLLPQHVFDDGKFTYFELSQNGPVPAIFAVDDQSGKESTVNTRRQGKYLVVQRIAPQFTLRQGGLVTSVFNVREIARIQQNKRPQ